MQMREYKYSAALDGSPPDLKGRTEAVEGDYVAVGNGPLRLIFAEGSRKLVSINKEGGPLGGLECLIAQFESRTAHGGHPQAADPRQALGELRGITQAIEGLKSLRSDARPEVDHARTRALARLSSGK